MRDIAVVGFAQSSTAAETELNEVEMLMPVLGEVLARAGVTKEDIGFVCSGSSDYLAGVPFSFVTTLDAVGPFPPISESHVDMDGAWALYEAWVKLQMGTIDTALVYAYGKSSPGDVGRVLSRQLDPYYLAPLWPTPDALAGLQARALIDRGALSEQEMAEIASARRASAATNPYAIVAGEVGVESLLDAPYVAAPLRASDCPPVTDGVAAVVLAADDRARELCDRPAWIRGIDHRIEAHGIGVRDITESPSTALAGERAGVSGGPVQVAELHTAWTSQEGIVRTALGLGDEVEVNPSGGPLCANTVMAAGLVRIGEVANRITDGSVDRGVAHATSGPCLQQNLVCVLEGE